MRTYGSMWVFAAALALIASVGTEEVRGELKGEADGLFRPATGSVAGGAADHRDLTLVRWDRVAAVERWGDRGRFVVKGFPLGGDLQVDLALKSFRVVAEGAQFVLGRRHGCDEPIDFDPESILFFRGEVVGRPQSHVFLALSDHMSTGQIVLGMGGRGYRISSRGDDGAALEPGLISVFPTSGAAGSSLPVPLCGVWAEAVHSSTARGATGLPNLRHLELAVETDYEFFTLFGDVEAATTYVIEMYAQLSDIYLRDVDTWVEIVFVRIWDDPDDLFNDVDPTPIYDFRDYWNDNMGDVHRDIAQLLSGRRDYPFGGQAFLSALCGDYGYSVVGYAAGFFPDPTSPSPYNYDIHVTAHEIGHNCGTLHTHDSPDNLDACDDPNSEPQRGTIMSYCSQTWSGGNSNTDNYFHSVIQGNMDDYIQSVGCVVRDCNMNGTPDLVDVFTGDSSDVNANGVPDECEDCNENGTLDDEDIDSGSSQDLNDNGVPDECEPDCNANNVPDDLDILMGTSDDQFGNDIPDECEADCNANGISDYTEIQQDMTLDIDRDTILDQCQDCDGDGITDIQALDGAHSIWIASGLKGGTPVRQFYADTGVQTASSSGSAVAFGQDVLVVDDGRVLVSSGADNRVMEFDRSGQFVGDLVPNGAGGLLFPTGLALASDGVLLVASRDTNSVLTYDVMDGTPLGAFVETGAGGLVAPFGMTFGPNGNLFATGDDGQVLEFDGGSGAFVGLFVSAANNGGLDQPRGLTFKSDGHLLVTSFGTNETLEYDGATGQPLGKWAQAGTETVLTQISPWGIRVAPNGNVFISRTGEDFGSEAHDPGDETDEDSIGALHMTNAQVYEFDVSNGNFIRSYVMGHDHDLTFATGFAFIPGWEIDCNLNLLPDGCDIASGTSKDVNGNGTPDECEVDCNANGVFDRLDIIPFGTSFDCNFNLNPDECDLAAGTSEDCDGNGTPDECEDCNGNDIGDACDIAAGTSQDCDANGIPDECIELEDDCNENEIPDACDLVGGTSQDCNANWIPDECIELEDDCNGNEIPDACDLGGGTSQDCNANGIPDECIQLEDDCNGNEIPDACDLAGGTSLDCNGNSEPDECEPNEDCNDNGVQDICDIGGGTSSDCTQNGIPDECDIDSGISADCNANGVPDLCDLLEGTSQNCNANGIPDECDIAGGTSSDENINGIPDECEDCNGNGVLDDQDILEGSSQDCNGNQIPDECDVAEGTSSDTNGDSIPDECQEFCKTNEDCDDGDECTSDVCGDAWLCEHVPDQCPCEGDANGDGLVDPLDSGFVLARFGCPVGTGDPDCDSADQNGDGVVDPLDSGFVLARFGDCP